MNILFVFTTAFIFTQISAAAPHQHNLCRKPYTFNTVQTILNLTVNLDGPTLIIDQHIPYGIRPMGNEISQISCKEDSKTLQIFAKNSLNQPLRFDFNPVGRPLVQPGTVTYLDPEGNPIRSEDWECSLEAASKLCLELKP